MTFGNSNNNYILKIMLKIVHTEYSSSKFQMFKWNKEVLCFANFKMWQCFSFTNNPKRIMPTEANHFVIRVTRHFAHSRIQYKAKLKTIFWINLNGILVKFSFLTRKMKSFNNHHLIIHKLISRRNFAIKLIATWSIYNMFSPQINCLKID